jgi:hypothetical protein
MNTSTLSLEQTPPLDVPIRFFLTMPIFGIFAGCFILYFGTDLLESRWSPSVLALTHLLTLGVLSMAMIGAMLQMLPILAVAPVKHTVIVSKNLHILLIIGCLSLSFAFVSKQNWLFYLALLTLSLCFFSFIYVVIYSLLKSKAKSPSISGIYLAVISLFFTVILGLILIAMLAFEANFSLSLITLTNLHAMWGLLGWLGLLIISIAYQVVPMFQITPPYNKKITLFLVPILFIILLLFLPFTFYLLPFTLFAIYTLYLQIKRLRKISDMSLNFWRAGMIFLLMIWFFKSSEILIGTIFIFGFTLSIIQGMLYKIIPFLVWLHLQNIQKEAFMSGNMNMLKIPHMKKIIPEKIIKIQFIMYILATLTLISSILFMAKLIYLAAILLIISFVLLEYNILFAYKVYKTEKLAYA